MGEVEGAKVGFPQFIAGLAMQTLVSLGKTPNPVSGETQTELPNAKYTIDLLGMLQEKTKGNLSPEEDKLLADILRDLRLAYVEATGKTGKP